MLKEWIEKRHRKRELEIMDAVWRMKDGKSWSLFPPSFYATHTEEEAWRAEERQLAECRELLKKLK